MGKASKNSGHVPACHRCTALLHGNQGRCSLCGWPVGSAYPAVDGEPSLAQEVTAETDESTKEPAEVLGAQLDALSAMADRQQDRVAAVTNTQTTLPQTAAAPEAETNLEQSESAEVAQLVLAGTVTAEPTTSGGPPPIDPLTSPLNELTEPVSVDEQTIETATDSQDPVDRLPEQTLPAPMDPTPVEASSTIAQPAPADDVSRVNRFLRPLLLVVGVANLALAGLGLALGPVDEGTAGLGQAFATLGLAMVTLGSWAAAAGLFLIWVSRMHRRVSARSAVHQRHSHTMAVAGWLIPVYGLFVGWQVLCDLWTGSDPATRDEAPDQPTQPRAVSVWLLSLVASVLLGFAAPLAFGNSSALDLASAAWLLVAAVALGSIVKTLAEWQQTPQTSVAADEPHTAA